MVLDPYVAASFASVIGRTLSADAVQRGRSLFAGKEGEQVADPRFRLVDDGLAPGGARDRSVRRRGHPPAAHAADRGRHAARASSSTPTRAAAASTRRPGNGARGSYRAPPSVGPTNLIVEPGDTDEAELLAAAGDGFYVMSVSGLHSGVNPISGTFSVGATGRLIRDGELAEPVREVTIASDLVSMLNAVAAVGSEARWVPFGGSVKVPALLIARDDSRRLLSDFGDACRLRSLASAANRRSFGFLEPVAPALVRGHC